jgi:YegS/Rv2252/BmrU family lipid kinase
MNYKTKVIVNPFSAFGKTKERWQSIKDELKSIFKELKFEFTQAPNHATLITREAINQGYNHIVGVGGDGTINEIINGYMEDDKPLNQKTIISAFPSGKGNDFFRTISEKTTKHWKEMYLEDKSRMVDVGKIKTNSGERYFLNVSSFGFSGEVARKIYKLKERIKTGAVYFIGALSVLAKYKAEQIRIIADGKEFTGKYLLGAVCNGKYFGGNMKVAPDAEADDGYFDLIILKETSKFDVLKKLIKVYGGKHINEPGIEFIRAKHIIIQPVVKEEIPIEYDGEVDFYLPAEFKIIPAAVKFKI